MYFQLVGLIDVGSKLVNLRRCVYHGCAKE
jgi:hypothetical protein